MKGYIDIRKISLDELIGVVNIYPWYGGARKELFVRMSRMEKDYASEGNFSEAALYIPSRRKLSNLVISESSTNLSDSEIDMIIKSYSAQPTRKVYAGVGDYFSQDDYDQVRESNDNVFSQYAKNRQKVNTETPQKEEPTFDLFTETLAQIYAEQGYFEQAKDIYSKLILAYPEKNAYFAALIRKLDDLN